MDKQVEAILQLLAKCSSKQRELIFIELRKEFKIHPMEAQLNIAAEIVLEAIHKDQRGLTFRMIRGVIAEAAFGIEVVARLDGWSDVTPDGDLPYDYLLADKINQISVQVKLQRSIAGHPMSAKKASKAFSADMFAVETQKTRGGTDAATNQMTRPYRFGEFDILAVSMQPSTGAWANFMYTVTNWLLPDPKDKNTIFKFQPIPNSPNQDWTDNFEQCVTWFRANQSKTIKY